MPTLFKYITYSEIIMRTKFFRPTPKPIPKTSQEAFEILSTTEDLSNIKNILFHFKQLVNLEKSTLTSHSRASSKIPNNQQFIENLEINFQKLQDAVQNERPYPSLFGDVCKLKEDLQVILGYYQAQIKRNQPIAGDYLRSVQSKHSEFHTLASEIAAYENTLLDQKDSNILTKYTINFCANDTMHKDIGKIGEIVQKPFLFDHKNEPKFSYM